MVHNYISTFSCAVSCTVHCKIDRCCSFVLKIDPNYRKLTNRKRVPVREAQTPNASKNRVHCVRLQQKIKQNLENVEYLS